MRLSTKLGLTVFTILITILGIMFFVKYIHHHKEKLIVGIRNSGVPLTATIRPENIFDGFDIEIARKIAKKLNRKLVIKNYLDDKILQALKTGDIDIICDSMAITKKRREEMAMVHVYAEPHAYLTGILWKEIPTALKSIHDLNHILKEKNKVACVPKYSVWFDVLQDYGIKNIITVNTEDELLPQLKGGKALIVFAGQFRADFFQRQNSQVKIFNMQLDEPWSFGAGICIKKENTTLITEVQNIIEELKANGTITQLQYKWFGKTYNKH